MLASSFRFGERDRGWRPEYSTGPACHRAGQFRDGKETVYAHYYTVRYGCHCIDSHDYGPRKADSSSFQVTAKAGRVSGPPTPSLLYTDSIDTKIFRILPA
ncbi:hypothetical protein SBA4_3910009 [Candidatus Sulfopaludibacter sp. SbA4]|nr:hypothetical protein SBA4_3910009 [Candidatus Sulfopaludibacter sp. SbA4]